MRLTATILLILLLSVVCFADWTVPFQVNIYMDRFQATRDTDTPWSIAADDSGNVHFVIETADPSLGETQNYPFIHYRAKRRNGSWGPERSVTLEDNSYSDGFGHPSIIFNHDVRGLITYCMDRGLESLHPEMRTREFNYYGFEMFGVFDFMSNQGSPYIPSGAGHAIKTPILAMDNNDGIYGFWIYRDTVNSQFYLQVYNNQCFNGNWGIEQSMSFLGAQHNASSLNALADPNGDIHLVVSMLQNPSDISYEVYHCWYDVSTGVWSNIECVSSPSGPDGNNSWLPYIAFSGSPNNYEMHAVWEEHCQDGVRVMYRKFTSNPQAWGGQVVVKSPHASEPTISVLSNNVVYVAWIDVVGEDQWVFYKYRNPITQTWSNEFRLTDRLDLSDLNCPIMVKDRWDNLHISFTGYLRNAPFNEYEVFYSFYDMLPLAPKNIATIPNNQHPVFKWSPCDEPSFGHYNIYKSRITPDNWSLEATTGDTTYTDYSVSIDPKNKQIIYYYVTVKDTLNQESEASSILSFHYNYDTGSKIMSEIIPTSFNLSQNYPNPFNSETKIDYAIPFAGNVKISIYDLLGREIRTLINEYSEPGFKSAIWDGRNNSGNTISTGTYFYRISAGDYSNTMKMTIIK